MMLDVSTPGRCRYGERRQLLVFGSSDLLRSSLMRWTSGVAALSCVDRIGAECPIGVLARQHDRSFVCRPDFIGHRGQVRGDRSSAESLVGVGLPRQWLNLEQREVRPELDRLMGLGQAEIGEQGTEPMVGL